MASVDVTGGAKFVSGYYLYAYDTTTQSIATPFTFVSVNINTVVFSNGITINNGSEITFQYPGKYNIQFSLQLTNINQQLHDFYLYLQQATTPVPNSTSVITVYPTHGGFAGHNIAAWNFFVDVTTPNEFFELIWGQNDKDVKIEYIATPAVGIPASPSVILTVSQI